MEKLYELQPNAKQEAKQLRQKTGILSRMAVKKSYVIPVVVHVFGKTFNGGTTVTQKIVEDALRTTNEDFQGLNADYTTIDAPFDAIKQPLDISFKLAKLDPNGNPTTGVIFHKKASGMGNYNSPEVRRVAWDNKKYCNIYITRDLYADGVFNNSGVAWYPNQTMTDQNIARIVYNGSYLAGNTNENFRSVFTHEFGHYLDLPHTFYGKVCSKDPKAGDGVADTPSHKKSSSRTQCRKLFNCFNEEINSENFMDYTDCYKMFTKGQVARMVNALENSPTRNTLWTDANLIATGLKGSLGARIATSGTTFNERYINDGVVDTSVQLTCEECTFTKSSGDLVAGTDYTTENLPNGLTAKINLTSNKKATVTLVGTAALHAKINSVSNFKITFLEGSITGGASKLRKNSVDNLTVSFNDVYTKYCNIGIRFATYTHITNVNFNGIENKTRYNGISNYISSIKQKVKKGKTYPLAITVNKGSGGNNDESRIQVWADWNNNFVYEDGELIITHKYKNTSTNASGEYTYNANVTIPNTAKLGNTAFRVLAHYVSGTEGDNSCSTVDSGESEDYGLEILKSDAPFDVDFSATATKVNFSQLVNFIDGSVPDNGDQITGWEWTFEGGQPSSFTGRSPQGVIFSKAGTYDVTLKVTTKNGKTKTVTKKDYITSRLEYCPSSPKFQTYFNVNRVKLNTINNNTPKNRSSNLYDTVFTELEVSNSYDLTIKTERGNGGNKDVNRVRVWADWNYDSQFSTDELIVSKEVKVGDYNASKEFEFTSRITVPATAAVGKKIGLRVIGHFVDGRGGETPCTSFDSGNKVDYGIIITKGSGTPKTVISEITADSKTEGNTLVHNVRLSKSTTASTVLPFVIKNGTATLGSDFNEPTFSNGVTRNGQSITVPANVSSFTASITTIDDSLDESDETYTIESGSLAVTGTIVDNDGVIPAKITAISNDSKTEGSTLIHNVTLDKVSTTPITFPFTIRNGTATQNSDFNAPTFSNGVTTTDGLSITVPANVSSFTVSVTTIDDISDEPNETYTVESGTITATGTIVDNDEPSTSDYCVASTLRNDSYITNVSYGTVNKSSAHNPYNDYSSSVSTFNTGDTFTLTVKTKNDHWLYNNIAAWVDWNNDKKFSSDEAIYSVYQAGPYTTNVTVPSNAVTNTNLRLRIRYAYGSGNTAKPCGEDPYFGEVEDYSIKVMDVSTPVNYCKASTSRNDSYITNVSFGTVNNTSTHSPYNDYSNLFSSYTLGQAFNLTVTTLRDQWTYNGIGVWIDWNNDGIFSNDENVYKKYAAGPYTTSITVPNNAVIGTPLRVRVRYSYGSESKIVPCGVDTYFGEVEDYAIKLTSSRTLSGNEFNVNKVTFFPNPAKDFIIISGVQNTSLSYTVANLRGQIVKNATIVPSQRETRISLDNLSSGIYIMRVTQNNTTTNKKIIISK